MKKSITFLELLELIKEKKQPKEVEYDYLTYKWENSGYYRKNVRDKRVSLLDIYTERYTMWALTDAVYIFYEESILTDSEKDYLDAVIDPFRYRVKYVKKDTSFKEVLNNNVIRIVWKDNLNNEYHVILPCIGGNFKGMVEDEEYLWSELVC